MSLLTEASLIVTPNAYKAGTLYSVIPNTTLGDMTVVRATSATRVNSAGLIEIARTNLVLQSGDLSQSVWSKANYALTSTTPIQGLTTTRITKNSTNNGAYNGTGSRDVISTIGTFAAGTKTLTWLIRKGNTDKVGFLINNVLVGALTSVICEFNFTTQTFTNVSLGLTASFENPTTDVYKIILTINDIGVGTSKAIWIAPIDNSNNTFDGGYLDFAFAQWELGSTATDYIPTTTSIRTKFAGITQDGSSASNIPRIDYPPLGGCPSILVEPQRTNLALYSEEFDNAAWTKVGSTISANSTTAPNGTTTADKLIEGTLLGDHYINRNITNSNSLFSFSVFAKKSERNFLFLQAFATVPNNFTYVPSAYFNLDNGTVGTVSSATATIQDYGNGWYRCTLNCTSIFSQLSASVGMYIMTATANGVSSYLGNGTSGIFIWGAQAEAGSSPTSYIPTVASSVTRNADEISKTGISSLIGQTEGTVFIDFNNQVLSSTILCINKNSTNSIFFTTSNAGTLSGRVYANSVSYSTSFAGYTTFNQKIKMCLKYGSFGTKLFINGELKATNSTPIVFTASLSSINLNDDIVLNANSTIRNNSSIIFKTALTDDQCILLTGPSFSSYPEMASALIYTLQ